jgi:hypothetical protein
VNCAAISYRDIGRIVVILTTGDVRLSLLVLFCNVAVTVVISRQKGYNRMLINANLEGCVRKHS